MPTTHDDNPNKIPQTLDKQEQELLYKKSDRGRCGEGYSGEGGAKVDDKTDDLNLEKQKTSLGLFGRLLGDRSSAPLSIAFVTILIGFSAIVSTLWIVKWCRPDEITMTKLLDLSSTLILTPLAYVFGRGGRD